MTGSVAEVPDDYRPPMSREGARLFAVGIRMAGKRPAAMRLDSIKREIAELLGEALAIEHGLTAINLDAMSTGIRARVHGIASWAVDRLDPTSTEEAKALAVTQVEQWASAKGDVSVADIAREAICVFQSIVVATPEAGR